MGLKGGMTLIGIDLRRRWFWISLSFFLVLISLSALFGRESLMAIFQLAEERERLIRMNGALRVENRQLMHEVHRLRNDQDYIEKIARETLGLVKDGELIFKFMD